MNWKAIISGEGQAAEKFEITENSTMQEIEKAQMFILDQTQKEKQIDIEIISLYKVDEEFITDLTTKVMPFQKAEGIVFYFLALLSGMSHKGILNDDLPKEQPTG